MLSIPCPSAQNEFGSCPSTGPAPKARRVLSGRASTHPNDPCNVSADPSLHARKSVVDNCCIISVGWNLRLAFDSSCDSHGSRVEQYSWNVRGIEMGDAGCIQLYSAIPQPSMVLWMLTGYDLSDKQV